LDPFGDLPGKLRRICACLGVSRIFGLIGASCLAQQHASFVDIPGANDPNVGVGGINHNATLKNRQQICVNKRCIRTQAQAFSRRVGPL
jgi:hypothetical protein